MATNRKSRKSRKNRPAVLGKPNGVIQDRVQEVGPDRFSSWLLRASVTSPRAVSCARVLPKSVPKTRGA